jgi:FkbM family methyltransferase
MILIRRSTTFYYIFISLVIDKIHRRNKKFFDLPKNVKDMYIPVLINKDFLSTNILFFNTYERFILKELVSFLNIFFSEDLKNKVVLDIGANLGNHTLYLSEFFKKVVAIEPNPMVFKVLKLNCEDHKNIEAYRIAISDKSQTSIFISHKANLANGGLKHLQPDFKQTSLHALSASGRFDQYSVESIKLDTFLRLYKLKPDVIKIDVEGAELNVLKGASSYLVNNSPVIVMELAFESFGTDKRNQLLDQLSKYGYTQYYVFRHKIDVGEFQSISHTAVSLLKNIFLKNLVVLERVKYPKVGTHRLVVITKSD